MHHLIHISCSGYFNRYIFLHLILFLQIFYPIIRVKCQVSSVKWMLLCHPSIILFPLKFQSKKENKTQIFLSLSPSLNHFFAKPKCRKHKQSLILQFSHLHLRHLFPRYPSRLLNPPLAITPHHCQPH